MKEFLLHSKNVIIDDHVTEAFIHVQNGIISNVFHQAPQSNIETVSVNDEFLMAGIIDPHVHINEPGRTEWEGFNTITRAAIAGGITTVVDMPLNASPVTTSVAAFVEKLAAAKRNLHSNCGFWGGIVPGNEADVDPLVEEGVFGFKAFLTHSGIDEFPNVTETDLRKVMPLIAKHNLPLLVHCELTGSSKLPTTKNKRSYAEYLASRPQRWEDDAIKLMIRLCEEFHCPVHIVHLSSASALEPIQRAKEQGLPLTVETAQHYLFFCAEEIQDGDTLFKCAPPIRGKQNNEALWQALKDGIIDFVATDHSPCTPDLKEVTSGDFTKAWGGIASIQFALPVLWTAAKQRGFAEKDIAKWLCQNPAKLIRQQANKGRIAEGYDADFVAWNPHQKFTVTESIIQHKHKLTPYTNKELFGVVQQTYLSGEKVYDRGELQLNKGKLIVGN